MSNLSPTEQAAKEFAINLEWNPAAKDEFLRANYQKSIWLQCPPLKFCQYGPPIPGADGFIFLLGEIWYNSALLGWVIRCRDAHTAAFEIHLKSYKAKKAIEIMVDEMWG